MELPGHSRHHHRRHHGDRNSSHKSRKASRRMAHEPRRASPVRHASGRADDPASYIESWLEETQAPAALRNSTLAEIPQRSRDETFRHHKGQPSHDSSIIAPMLPRHRRPSKTHHVHQVPKMLVELRDAHDTGKRKRARPSPSLQSENDHHVDEQSRRYEKRARHKTREDKYEQNRGGAAPRRPVEDERNSKKRKTHDKHNKKKSSLATTSDLMDKFSSHAIHNDRLTVKPSMQAGIFRNSKVDRAPGDLTFGEMSFLKEGRAQEMSKVNPKSRSKDHKKNQKELEDIESFFSHGKLDTVKANNTSREKGDRPNPQKLGARDASPCAAPRSRQASAASRATTYLSWSSSNHPPTRPEKVRNERSAGSSSPSYSRSRENSLTPGPIQQALIETGIYRPLSEPERLGSETVKKTLEESPNGHDVETGTAAWQSVDSVAPEAHEYREHIAQQAYVNKRDLLPQLPDRPPQHGPKAKGGRDPETKQVPVPLWNDDKARCIPSGRSGTQQTVPIVHTVGSPSNSHFSSQVRSAAVMAPPHRPPSTFRFAASAFPPGPHVRPQPTHSPGRVPTVFDPGRWLLNTSPHIRDPSMTTSLHQLQSELAHPEEKTPGVYASGGAISPPRNVQRESVCEYIENLERKVLGAEEANVPSAVPTPDVEHEEPYLAPYFRHGPATGFMPTRNVGASGRGSWKAQSNRHSIRTENSSPWVAPQYAPRGETALHDEEHLPPDTRQRTTLPASSDENVDYSMSRCWKPNTCGLL